jgi:hypothetical protein
MSLRFQDADLKFYFDNDKIDEIIVQNEGVISKLVRKSCL